MFAVSYENRPLESIGLRALALSLERHAPGIVLLVADRDLPSQTRDWLARRPNVRFFPIDGDLCAGWAVKADVIAAALDHVGERVTWIDADILLSADPSVLMVASDQTLIISEEHWILRPLDPDAYLATWGLPKGRDLRVRVNDAVISVAPPHRDLIERWRVLLRDPIYLRNQCVPFPQREPGAQSVMEVMSVLLCSNDFAGIPIRWLRGGRDIAHCMGNIGWSATERLACGFTLPPFVHGQGEKPWFPDWQGFGVQISPYTEIVSRWLDVLSDQNEVSLPPRSWAARIQRGLAGGNPSLQGFLHAALWEMRIRAKIGNWLKRFFPGNRQ